MEEKTKKEKYLTVVILGNTRVNCWKVDKTNEKAPDFRGEGVAVWINEKLEKQSKKVEEEFI